MCLCLAASACLALAACSNLKVKLPSSDSTPPSLVWTVFSYDTNATKDHAGSPDLQAKLGERYRVTLKAKDPQGVKSIQVNPSPGTGEINWLCNDSPGGEPLQQAKHALLGPMTQNLSPDSNGYVLTSIFLIHDLDFALTCPSGWTFAGGNAKLTGRATNYHGGVTTAVITFAVSS
jgi:hypothetical protein